MNARLRRVLRHPLPAAGLAVVVVGVVADRAADLAYSGNREAVIQIMGRLGKGMSRQDVERLLAEHETRFAVKHSSPEGLMWWTHTGLASAWSVSVTFSPDNRLATARVFTEDGPYHPNGVPPDIR